MRRIVAQNKPPSQGEGGYEIVQIFQYENMLVRYK